jgi:hypothetical protein
MSKAPPTFRQRDVRAAIKAVAAAGHEVVRVEIDKAGKIVILTGKQAEATIADGDNPWDR